MKAQITLLVLTIILTLTLTACYSGATASSDQDSEVLTTNRPDGWSEATHGKDAEPNYAVVFPNDKVNQITITISPENWETMQANMTELFGEAGSSNGDRGMPGAEQPPLGDRPQPGQGNIPEDDQQPPIEDQLQPGQQGFPEGVEPPEVGFPDRPEGFSPPENGDRPEFRDGNPQAGRPGDGGLRGGDMTPENPMWVAATIEFEGRTWTNVGVRYKGNSSLTSGWRSGTLKLPLKLDFDEFEDEYPEIDDQRFYGFKQLSLANGFSDSSFLRDATTSLILEEAGLPAAKTAFYEVIIDYGEGPVSLGLYTMIEVIDDTVVDRYFGSNDGNIYEAEGTAASFADSTFNQIDQSFQKENNQDSDWSDIEALFKVLHSELRSSDPAAWRAELESNFDVNGFLEWLAITAVIQHWDAYGNMSHNYYLYNNPETGQLSWISWDHNMAMSTGMGGGRGPGGGRSVSLDKSEVSDDWPLIRYLLDDPIYYDRYLDYLAETIEVSFNPNRMSEVYQSLATLIEPYAVADVGEDAFDDAVQQLIDHAYQRADAVEQLLDSVDR